MIRAQCAALASALLIAVVATAPAIASTIAEVSNIKIVDMEGQIQKTFEELIPPGPDGHYELETLYFGEKVGDSTSDPKKDLWWDVVIEVEADLIALELGTAIALDKDVTNHTPFHWTDFHMTVGMGAGANFVASDESDYLFVENTDPDKPRVKDELFPNPPMVDEDSAPDQLWWLQDANTKGVDPGVTASFWFAVNIPKEKFVKDSGGNFATARFTLRQHASIPEPGTIALAMAAIGGLGLAAGRRRNA